MKVLGPISGFQAYGSRKGTGSPQEIWFCMPMGFDGRTATRQGETETPLSEGMNKTLCAPGTRRKEQRPHRRPAWVCLGVSGEGAGWCWPAAGFGHITVHAWDLLREVTIIFITSTLVWPQVNSRKGTPLHPSTETGVTFLLILTYVHVFCMCLYIN